MDDVLYRSHVLDSRRAALGDLPPGVVVVPEPDIATTDLRVPACSIDLHPRSFPAGSCAQTTLGPAGVIILALDDEGADYRILVRPSFAGYLADWIVEAAQEFRTDPAH